MKNEWIKYEDLKKRWYYVFETDEDFLLLMLDGIKAFKYYMPEPRSLLGGEDPFIGFEPQSVEDLRHCYFMLEHVKSHENPHKESGPIHPSTDPETWEKLTGKTIPDDLSKEDVDVHYQPKGVVPLPEKADGALTEPNFKDKDYVFYKKGSAGWQVKFEDETTDLKHLKPLSYITQLLQNEGHEFSYLALDQRVNGVLLEEESGEPELNAQYLKNEKLSPKAKADIQDWASDAYLKWQNAKNKGDDKKIKESEENFLRVTDFVRDDYGVVVYEKDGRLQYGNKSPKEDSYEAIRKSVASNISRAKSVFKKPMPKFYKHLFAFINAKNGKVSYQPTPDKIDWHIKD